jgi:hypothetical protein
MRIIKKIFRKSRSLEDGIFFGAIEQILGFPPINLEFYKKAFTHRSSNIIDTTGNPSNYERLEFLGDAMLSAVIAAYLFDKAPTGFKGSNDSRMANVEVYFKPLEAKRLQEKMKEEERKKEEERNRILGRRNF